MFVCCECCVFSGRGLCDGLITRPGESYRLWRVVVFDQETSNEEAKARYGAVNNTTKRVVTPRKQNKTMYMNVVMSPVSRSQWPRGRRRRSAAARLLRLWVRIRISPGSWMFVCCECFSLLCRGLCDGLITRLHQSYRMWCVVECDLETS